MVEKAFQIGSENGHNSGTQWGQLMRRLGDSLRVLREGWTAQFGLVYGPCRE